MIHVLRCEEINEDVCRQIIHNCMTECFGFSPIPSEIKDIDHRLVATFPNDDKLQVTFQVKKVRYKLLIMADFFARSRNKTKYDATIYICDYWGERDDLKLIKHEFHIDTPLGISLN